MMLDMNLLFSCGVKSLKVSLIEYIQYVRFNNFSIGMLQAMSHILEARQELLD
jgi:hypothetical protein